MATYPTPETMGILAGGEYHRVDISEPPIEYITLEDIFSGLANVCRYAGNVNQYYSVAKHSIIVARLAVGMAKRSFSPQCNYNNLMKYCLLHDASEAFLGDLIAPLKRLDGLSEVYQRYETIWQNAIIDKFIADADDLNLCKQLCNGVDKILPIYELQRYKGRPIHYQEDTCFNNPNIDADNDIEYVISCMFDTIKESEVVEEMLRLFRTDTNFPLKYRG